MDIDLLKYKKIILKILIDVDMFCKENDIKYSLYAGTLIGAIRHNGFIPWDDDIDIIMDSKNITKFISLRSEFSKKYDIVCPMDDNPLMCPRMIKVFDRNCCIKEVGVSKYQGAFIDIFSTMGLKYKSRNRNLNYTKKYRFICRMYEYKIGRFKINSNINFVSKLAYYSSKFFTKKGLEKRINKYQKYSNDFDICTTTFGGNYIMKKSYFDDLVLKIFEGYELPVPRESHELLNEMYGDYMKLPPIDDRENKHLEYINFNENYKKKNGELDGKEV